MSRPMNTYTCMSHALEPLNEMHDIHPHRIQHPPVAESATHHPSPPLPPTSPAKTKAETKATATVADAEEARNEEERQHRLSALQRDLETFRNKLRHDLGSDAPLADISGIWPRDGGAEGGGRGGNAARKGVTEEAEPAGGEAPMYEPGWRLVDERNGGIWLDVDALWRDNLGSGAVEEQEVEDGASDPSSRELSESESEEDENLIVWPNTRKDSEEQLDEGVSDTGVDADGEVGARDRRGRCASPRPERWSQGPSRRGGCVTFSGTSEQTGQQTSILLNGGGHGSMRSGNTAEGASSSGPRVRFAPPPVRTEAVSPLNQHNDDTSSGVEHIESSSAGHGYALGPGYRRHYSSSYQNENRRLWDEEPTRGRSRERRADVADGGPSAVLQN